MYYINHIDCFSIHANFCSQKSLKHTCPCFDSVVPLILHIKEEGICLAYILQINSNFAKQILLLMI